MTFVTLERACVCVRKCPIDISLKADFEPFLRPPIFSAPKRDGRARSPRRRGLLAAFWPLQSLARLGVGRT